ncbi:MAG: hypothetical protein NC453_11960 [Muribaculum sp.]|nr:hypothetical protein [Muribaculum sp.]
MKYIANYDTTNFRDEYRSINLAASNVMEYMSYVFSSIEDVEIISPSRTLANRGFFKSRTIKLKNKISLKLPFTFGVQSKLGRMISIFWTQIWLLWILLFKCKRQELIVVYHSAAIMRILSIAKWLKNLCVILEIREIYSDINANVNKKTEQEYFKIADKYIFATQLLNDRINAQNKPYVIAPGIYQSKVNNSPTKWNDGKIHLVYAGNFRRAKGGAIASILIAKYLTPDYVIHILGSGDENSISEIKNLISIQNSKHKANVIFEGLLVGNEFDDFLQKCDIGLSTQDPSGTFNESSFPSKVLTYLGNGLEVISANISAVSTSPVGRYIHYYSKHEPESIAKAIMGIKELKKSMCVLNTLDDRLHEDIHKLLTDRK